VTEDSDVRRREPEPVPDLEYDLAHEAGTAAGGGGTPPTGQRKDPMVVPTETTGYDGDYGYDLAHDIPRS